LNGLQVSEVNFSTANVCVLYEPLHHARL